jgi:hypothetical protein
LPDFWLRKWNCFAEVKGGTEQWDARAMRKAEALARESRLPVLLLDEFKAEDWCVPVLSADANGAVGSSWCDMLRSVERERCWFDDLQSSIFSYLVKEGEICNWQIDARLQWEAVVNYARNARFEHDFAAA